MDNVNRKNLVYFWNRVYRCRTLHNELNAEWQELNNEIWVRNVFHN